MTCHICFQDWLPPAGRSFLYEKVVASRRAAAERVFEFLRLPFPRGMELPGPAVEKQTTRISEEWTAATLSLEERRLADLRPPFGAPKSNLSK